MANDKQRVVILGAGMSGLLAAHELSRTEALRRQFEVTVYAMGWRCGGKCASSRDLEDFNLEHGLHFFGAYYDNAFSSMREAYRVMREVYPQHKTVEQAFTAQTKVAWLVDVNDETKLVPMDVIAENKDLPPEGRDAVIPTPGRMVLTALGPWGVRMAKSMLELLLKDVDDEAAQVADDDHHAGIFGGLRRLAGRVLEGAEDAVEAAVADLTDEHTILGWLIEHLFKAIEPVVERIEDTVEDAAWALLAEVLEDVRSVAHALFSRVGNRSVPTAVLSVVLDLVTTQVIGLQRDGVLSDEPDADGREGFDKINGTDFTAWLGSHGALPSTLDSKMLKGAYDYLFAYVNGDPTQRTMDAGVASRMIFRFMLQNPDSAIQWRMMAGMGEAVISPLYVTLKQHGVRFEFFHRVDAVEYDPLKGRVRSVKMTRQLDLQKLGITEFQATYAAPEDKDAWRRWPELPRDFQVGKAMADRLREEFDTTGYTFEDPFWDLEGHATPVEIHDGEHFDVAVMSMSIDAARMVGTSMEVIPRWKEAMDTGATTPICAAQIWTKEDIKILGGDTEYGQAKISKAIAVGQNAPFVAWADMFQTLAVEWGPEPHPKGAMYLCGGVNAATFDMDKPPIETTRSIARQLDQWLEDLQPDVWPGYKNATLARSTYVRGSVMPSDRYVISPAKATAHRLFPEFTDVANLCLVGDWLKTGLDMGCVEACAISARKMVRHLTDDSYPIPGERDYPEQGPVVPPAPQAGPWNLSSDHRRDYGTRLMRDLPYGFEGAVLRGLVVPCDPAGAARMCNLLSGKGVQYTPLESSHAIVLMVRYPVAWTGSATEGRRYAYHEMGVALPVWNHATDTPSWFLPYLFVDDVYPMVLGRERYGFNKAMAQIQGLDGSASADIHLDAPVLYAPGEAIGDGWGRLIDVTHSEDADFLHLDLNLDGFDAFEGALEAVGLGLEKQLEELAHSLVGGNGVDGWLRHFLTGFAAFETLRQLPTLRDEDDKVMEAIHTPIEKAKLHRVRLLPPGEVTVHELTDNPLQRDLFAGQSQPIRGVFAYEVDLDFQLAPAERVWSITL